MIAGEPSFARLVKRTLDVVLAASILLCAAPVLAVTALAVWATMGRPILFRQDRPGKDGRIFQVWKLRTMHEGRDAGGELLAPDLRLTPLGRFLRTTSLDELPQLFNILRGDMSLVGPRPLLVEYLPLYNERQKMRHRVRPGITGLAQVNGRNALDWPERLELDVWYVENWSLGLDLRILAQTVVRVLRRDGVEPPDASYMPKFSGVEAPSPPENKE